MNIPIPGILITGPVGENTLRLEEYLNSGAFGDVYRAKETTTGDIYAVKFPRIAGFNNGDEITAFLNEVQAAQEIEHPNVVRVVHVETNSTDLPPYLVMEFVEGGTLKSCLGRLRDSGNLVDIDHLQTWSSGLIDGIAAINAKMLHRDLKPDNILMDDDIPKIGDFGLSKIVGAMTRSKTFKGGQHMLYMAPEGWKQETNEIQIDMYAMGIVLYEIASLQYPYELPSDSGNVRGFMDMHLYQSPKSLQELIPDLPMGFGHLVSRLMQKRPQDRFPNWSEVKDALEKAWELHEFSRSDSEELVTVLLGRIGEAQESSESQRLEEEKRKAEYEERRRLDLFQESNLIDCIRMAVSDFNKHSNVGKIEESKGQHAVSFSIPDPRGISVRLHFFWIDPPIKIRRGRVRFTASLSTSRGFGLNYLLCRKDDSDLYGQWVACRVKRNPISMIGERGPEPFGFDDPEKMREIEMADRAVNIYVVDFNDDIKKEFLQILSYSV